MVKYRSEDYEVIDWEVELKRVLGDKFTGCEVRTPNEPIEFTTTIELEPSEINEVKSLTGKDWIKQ